MLGCDIHQHALLLLSWMLNLPTAAFHIDSNLSALGFIFGLCQKILQCTIHISAWLRCFQITHTIIAAYFCLGLRGIGGLNLVIEQLGIASTAYLIIQAIQHFVGSEEAVALACGVINISFSEMAIESLQHIVDTLTNGVEGQLMHHRQILSNLRHEKSGSIEAVFG